MGKNRPTSHRVLLVRLSAFGDIIHVLPSLDALREAIPTARIDWLVEDRFASLLEGIPGLNEVLVVPRSVKKNRWLAYLRLARRIRKNHYDIVVDFQGLTKSAVWGVIGKIPTRIGFGTRMGGRCPAGSTPKGFVRPKRSRTWCNAT